MKSFLRGHGWIIAGFLLSILSLAASWLVQKYYIELNIESVQSLTISGTLSLIGVVSAMVMGLGIVSRPERFKLSKRGQAIIELREIEEERRQQESEGKREVTSSN